MSDRTTPIALLIACTVALAGISACTQAALQSDASRPMEKTTMHKKLKLEKVRDVAHLLRQINDNLGNDILLADPEWLEQQWGIRIYGWRPKRHLPELERTLVDGKQIEPEPMGKMMIQINSGVIPATGKQSVTIRISMGHLQNQQGATILPIEQLEAILGKPSKEERIFPNPEPPPADERLRTYRPRPMHTGPKPMMGLEWSKENGISISSGTRYGSEIHNVIFNQLR